MKLIRQRVGLLAAIVAAIAVSASGAQAAAPAPGFERFAGCPSPAELPSVEVCLYSKIKSGHFQMGNKNVPISKPMTLTGGTNGSLEGFVATPQGGLSPVKQQVPGGITGLTGLDRLVNFLDIDSLQLFAVTELVGPPVIGEGLSLPIRVHLINPVLGKNCYVGSPSNPIQLNLIEGTTNPPPPNEPISGQEPEFIVEQGLIKLLNGTY